MIFESYGQEQLTPSFECGHDALPKKYQYDYTEFDEAAYAKFMKVEHRSDRTDQQATSRNAPITVTFKNTGKVAVDRYWASNDKLIKYGVVKAGQTFQQSTSVGHKWVFKDRDITVGTYTANERNKTYVVSPMDDSCFEIPVDLVVVYKSDGTGNESKAELYEKFDRMNKHCENSNLRVRFKIARFEQVYSDNYYSIPRDYDKMTEIRDQYTNFPKTVPLIQTGDIGTGGLGGVHWLAASGLLNETVWLHEIGHFFGLHHTHAEAGEGKELVNGSNCSVAGDLICDTPATPNTWNLGDNCIYSGTERDPNGQLYQPDVKNVMAYAQGCPEGGTVSPEQEKRLLFFLRNNYTEMNPCAAPVNPSDCKFDLIAGRARDIGSGGGQTYVVDSNGEVFKRTTSSWEQLPSDFEGVRLDVTENGIPWVISTYNKIYYYENNRWVNTNGGGIEIGCGGNEVYVIATNNRIYRRVNNDWELLPLGTGKRLDVGENGRPWMIGMDDQPYEYNNNFWEERGTHKMQDIGVADRGQNAYGVDIDGTILEYIGNSLFGPAAIIGNSNFKGRNITVVNDNSFWVSDQNEQIHTGVCEERSETEVPATLPEGTYSMISKLSNKALSLYGWGQDDGTNIIQWDYLDYENQQWVLDHLGDNVYTVTSKYSNKALSVTAARTTNGTNIHQWQYIGVEDQKWKIQPVGDGYYRLLAVHSGKALSIDSNLTTNGANIHQWEYVGASSQKWRFDEVIGTSRSIQEEHRMEVFASKGRSAKIQFVANQAFKPTQYHIQHATDNVNFLTIRSLAASDSPDLATYDFTHPFPQDGKNYYQVVVEYEDGYQETIPAQSLDFAASTHGISIFPNPAQDELFIGLQTVAGQEGQITIVNPFGQPMQSINIADLQEGTLKVNTASFQNGLYYLNIELANQKPITEKLLINRLY